MIALPRSPNFDKNLARVHGDVAHCVVCGKALGQRAKTLRIYEGSFVISVDEMLTLNEAGDCGYYSVGAECARQYPELKPYLKNGE